MNPVVISKQSNTTFSDKAPTARRSRTCSPA